MSAKHFFGIPGNRRSVYRPALVVAVCLASAVVAAQSASASGSPSSSRPAAEGPAHARITGAPILGTAGWESLSASEAAPSTLPSKSQQIKVLAAVLKKMKDNYKKYNQYTPGPQDIFDYGIGPLWMQGIDGAGTTVAVIEGWDYKGIAQQVASFDKTFGLPNPVIDTIFPNGPLPAKCPPGMVKLGSYGSCSAWAGELTLDVLSAHLIAPYAKIVISATPADSQITDDAASQVAPPEMMKALEYISAHHVANVISISDGTGETTYSHGLAEILANDPGELTAAAAGIPVLVATGDCGVVQNLAVANGQCEDVSSTPDTAAWDDSPWVTAVGGSVPNLSPNTGARIGPDPVWHVAPDGAMFSEGAGFSSVFARPEYQEGVSSITGSSMRSVPDITMDAQVGTSEAAPLFAGVLALATQQNQGNVGPINPVLYGVIGPGGSSEGISDVVKGNDSAEKPDGTVTVPGFTAGKGFDVASGWGTIYAPKFVPSLVSATRSANEDHATRAQAMKQLEGLQNGIQLSKKTVSASGLSYLSAGSFLPEHPIGLYVDGRHVADLTANTLGDVTYMISAPLMDLGAGTHTVELESMLLNETASLTVT
jgi:subtilase family serine protease